MISSFDQRKTFMTNLQFWSAPNSASIDWELIYQYMVQYQLVPEAFELQEEALLCWENIFMAANRNLHVL